ncbi:MAG: rod shape-determining protein RodA [Clostridia bacterium]|nr:rod shape-determining protein RodA [Clostridia bacterium]
MGLLIEKLKKIDIVLFICVVTLSIIGLFLIASASKSNGQMTKTVIIQSAGIILGIALCLFLAFSDYEALASHSFGLFLFNVLFLILVLVIGTGREEVGGRSWIRFAGIGIQPAEFVKIGFIISFASQLSKIQGNVNKPKNLFFCLLHIGVLVGLILLQPDAGTAIMFLAIFFGMLFFAGLSYKYIITGLAVAGASLVPLWMFVFEEYQKNRIRVFFNPELDPQHGGYHVIQSKLAVGSGGLFGKGLFNGVQTQLGYLPASHTDFIFSVAGEELGFMGCLVIVLLIMFIIGRIIYTASKADDKTGAFIAVGVASMLLAQSFENIGMTIGLTPVTGITLPFLSYGGSSVVASFMAIGLVLNVHMKNKGLNF